MKKALQYFIFALVVFALLTVWDLLSGMGLNLLSNAVHTLLTTLIYWGFHYYQNKKKDAQ